MITRFLKVVSAITSVFNKSVRYVQGLLWPAFGQFQKMCTLQRGVRYIGCPLWTGWTLVEEVSFQLSTRSAALSDNLTQILNVPPGY